MQLDERDLCPRHGHGGLRRGAPRCAKRASVRSSVRQASRTTAATRRRSGSTASTPSTRARTSRSPSTSACRSCSPSSVDDKYETLHTKVNNYWKGHWIKHPAQVNLYGLPDRPRRQGHQGLRRRRSRRDARRDRELRAMAARELRRHVRRDVPDGVHDQVPHDRREEHEPRLDRAAALPGQARGGPARRAGAGDAPTCTTSTASATRSHGGFVSVPRAASWRAPTCASATSCVRIDPKAQASHASRMA